MSNSTPSHRPQPEARAHSAEPSRLLVVTLSNIGDVVMTTPVFEALAAAHPGTLIDVFADPRSAALLSSAPYTGEIFLYRKRAGWRARAVLLRALRQRRYSLVVDLRSPILAYLLRADMRLRRPHKRIPGRHAVEEHFALLAPLLPGVSAPPCRLHPAAASHAAATQMLSHLPGSRWLAVAPGANWPGKKWPRQHYRALLELAAPHFDGVMLLGSAQDSDDIATLADLGVPTLAAAGQTTLDTAAALLARACAFVGNDSGLGHIAAAMGTPTLTVFGPGDPQRYRPWGPNAHVVLAPDQDLAALGASEVWLALQALLAQTIGQA
jgi:heptosyltransferase-3